MCYILRLHHTLCLPPARNTNSSNLVRNSPTSLCTFSRETVRPTYGTFSYSGSQICAKRIFGGNIYVRLKFSCVRSFLDLCAGAHAHSLEGTLVIMVTV